LATVPASRANGTLNSRPAERGGPGSGPPTTAVARLAGAAATRIEHPSRRGDHRPSVRVRRLTDDFDRTPLVRWSQTLPNDQGGKRGVLDRTAAPRREFLYNGDTGSELRRVYCWPTRCITVQYSGKELFWASRKRRQVAPASARSIRFPSRRWTTGGAATCSNQPEHQVPNGYFSGRAINSTSWRCPR